jgi:hypothetical protein
MFRIGDKKEEEEKYCQENFNSDVEQFGKGFGIGFGVILGLVLIIYIAYRTWSYFKNKKKEAEKINRITEYAQQQKSAFCETMNIVEAKTKLPDPTTYANCTCYYDDYEVIRGCTNHDNIININEFYKTQLQSAKDAISAKK